MDMSARASALVGLVLVAVLALDLAVLQSGGALFLLRKLAGLIEYLAFWR